MKWVFVDSKTRKPRRSSSGKRFLLGELIGEETRISFSSDKSLDGLVGKIVDETLNTFVLHTGKGLRTIPKVSCTFSFPDAGVEVSGRLLLQRPEDRTKKLFGKL